MIRFGSVCSGIEAASVAWEPLGWRADWVAEVEAFPSSVLAHRWPSVPNLGDMTRLPEAVANDNIAAPDVLVGGTPCQAFSVAGLRQSLNDARGQLTLSFVRLADEIDRRRAAAGLDPAVIVWENVPGVLSTKDNAFGCFLAGLVGEDQPLFPAGARWSNAGCVSGPQRAAAWRILDAQYFGVAQRRRRVFVVASSRDGFDPATVLFEFDGVRRDSAPRREKGQGPAAAAGSGPAVGSLCARSGRSISVQDAAQGHLLPQTFDRQSSGEYGDAPIASTVSARDYKSAADLVLQPQNDNAPQAIPILEAGARTGVSTTDPRAGIGIGAEGDPMFTLQAGKQHGVAVAVGGDIAHTLKAEGFDASEDGTGRGVPVIGFPTEMSATQRAATPDLSPSLSVKHTTSIASPMAVRRLTPRECERLQGFPDDHTLVPHRGKPAADGPRYKALGNSMAVPVMRWIGERIDRALRDAAGNDN